MSDSTIPPELEEQLLDLPKPDKLTSKRPICAELSDLPALFNTHTKALLTKIDGELPKSYKDKVKLDVAQLWDSADATDGYNQYATEAHQIIQKHIEGVSGE